METPNTTTHKGFKTTAGLIGGVVVLLIIVVGVFVFFSKPSLLTECGTIAGLSCPKGFYCELQGPENMSDRAGICKFGTAPKVTSSAGTNTSSWQTYQDQKNGFEFRYPANWSLSVNGSKYDSAKPFILLWTGTVSYCEYGCIASGDRIELTSGDTTEGAPPINPWYKFLQVKNKTWISLQVTDTSKNCTTSDDCFAYTKSLPIEFKQKVAGLSTYNSFLDIISTFKFTK